MHSEKGEVIVNRGQLMNRVRIVFAIVVVAIVLAGIGSIFWYQELRFLLPTPVPKGYRVVAPKALLKFDTALIPQNHPRPLLLHFFNPDCPCSKFNLNHFRALRRQYQDVDFYVVVSSREKVEMARKYFDEDMTILVDDEWRLAAACGVYSTPQAVVIQTNNTLFFRGNYNRARYCTDPKSNFVQMALDSLAAKKGPPHFIELATQSYGCSYQDRKSALQQLYE